MADEPGSSPEWRFTARSDSLREIRAVVRQTVVDFGAADLCADDIVMAIDEACQNIIRHSYSGDDGEIVIRIERNDADLVISLIDFAPKVDAESVRGRDLDDVKPGGLGTHLMRETMDEVEFAEAPPGCGNLLRMVKRIS
jgi:sigma-B regulation protein RsbU (phosphoserine phosphatase)